MKVTSISLVMAASLLAELSAKNGPLQFNRDVRPILSDKCFACHGPDENKRKGELRLDTRDGLFAIRENTVITPGKPQESELHHRIHHDAPEEQMPPAEMEKQLTEKEKSILTQWITEGAKWEGHWAWIPPARPKVPPLSGKDSGLSPIDRFLQKRILKAGLATATPADPRTLVRRLHLDLVGLPPEPSVVEAFITDPSPKAYQRLVNDLLASPHFGERLAILWLDLVRYADSVGYQKDRLRECWLYRDYVIDAFNSNKPYNRFIVEQLAGDLLKDNGKETQWFRVASGFNRLNQTTSEGGAQAREYIAKYAADRVRNTSAIFLGTTLGCAECHNHKYDPFTIRDFYAFSAFFADVKERGVGYPEHTSMPTRAILDEQADLLKQVSDLKKKMADSVQEDEKKELESRILPIEKRLGQLANARAWPKTLVTLQAKPRVVRLLPRGNWLDDSGPVMQPSIPAFLGNLDTGDRPATRLDLARWIASRDNPLTARVFVNRIWKLLLGRGLSRNLDDLGSQGDWPSHPELLDWLSVEFMDSGWDIHGLIRVIVHSQAYQRSSSHHTPGDLFEKQATFRLEAELVRDNALAISGLLNRRIGGRSVKPYQPANYWFRLYNTGRYVQDRGENLYRRGVYTLWRRSFWHPSLQAFDAPSREECVAERPISNTPLQALVLLNDPTYVEAARKFAGQLIIPGKNDRARIDRAFRLALARPPTNEESKLLIRLLEHHRSQFAGNPNAAKALLQNGEAGNNPAHDSVELAAWTSVTRTILNLHETITRN